MIVVSAKHWENLTPTSLLVEYPVRAGIINAGIVPGALVMPIKIPAKFGARSFWLQRWPMKTVPATTMLIHRRMVAANL